MSPFAARQHLSAQALAGHTKLDLHVGKAQRELNAEAAKAPGRDETVVASPE
eukprot:CAMPEP_0171556524 /NCGR_PEP_ID=MMETSP0960-20121227/10781_1 /TAXON_ID=87120 /ORGANISM="Aurantiochytrium limacinum, Strain ATCCMYA-1381" /LENGTH=51 /DNA_ID=CAMNT_0012106807 /DNA_START=409 /DNA_END=563 /DNA_ORIENTATION=+